jgi:S1-C subfamily serine protease
LGDVIKLDRIADDEDVDASLLRVVSRRRFSPVFTCFAPVVDDGEQLYVLGFPLGRPLTIKAVTKSNEAGKRWQIAGRFDGGNSGGPVFDTAGRLIGLVHSHISDSDISYVVPVNHFSGFFQRAGVLITACSN